MLMPKDEIIADIQDQIRKGGGNNGAWCVGTAKDSHGTLFTRHETEDLQDGWIYREAFTPGVACDVRDYFVAHCGTDTAASDENEGGRLVYAYKKTSLVEQSTPAPAPQHPKRGVVRWRARQSCRGARRRR